MTRAKRQIAVPSVAPVATIAALSVALLLSVPAAGGSHSTPIEPTRQAATRDALASLIETLNDAARCLAGVTAQKAGVVANRPSVAKPVIATAERHAAPRDSAVLPNTPPLREALRNLPPPTA